MLVTAQWSIMVFINSFIFIPQILTISSINREKNQIELEEDWGLNFKLLLLTFKYQRKIITIYWIWVQFYI